MGRRRQPHHVSGEGRRRRPRLRFQPHQPRRRQGRRSRRHLLALGQVCLLRRQGRPADARRPAGGERQGGAQGRRPGLRHVPWLVQRRRQGQAADSRPGTFSASTSAARRGSATTSTPRLRPPREPGPGRRRAGPHAREGLRLVSGLRPSRGGRQRCHYRHPGQGIRDTRLEEGHQDPGCRASIASGCSRRTSAGKSCGSTWMT